VGCTPWASSNRSSLSVDPPARDSTADTGFSELDKALESVRSSLDARASNAPARQVQRMSSTPILKRHHSLSTVTDGRTSPALSVNAQTTSRTRRSVRQSLNPRQTYETPDEEEELLDEALTNARRAARRLEKPTPAKLSSDKENTRPPITHVTSDPGYLTAYLTPSPSKDNNIGFGQTDMTPTKSMVITPRRQRDSLNPQWPTPPYDDYEWASSAAASILAVHSGNKLK
jgi:meiosis induction protein kinase IME2/SME1